MNQALDEALLSAQSALNEIGDRERPGDAANPMRRRLKGIIQSMTRANELSVQPTSFEGDTSVTADVGRDIMQMVNEERQIAREEREAEDDIDFLQKIRSAKYVSVAKLIQFSAEFADEDAHGLISETAKRQMSQNGGSFPKQGKSWDFFVSPKLEAHCREVTEIIKVRHARNLGNITTESLLNWETQDSKAILTAYCRCVATRWRTSSIIAGQQYKSTKMIDTIKQAFLEHLSFFSGVARSEDGTLCLFKPRPFGLDWNRDIIVDA